jgi:integrase
VDLTTRQLCIQRSEWNGHVTVTKGGRRRYVRMTLRLATALREHRHLRGPRVLYDEEGTSFTRQQVQYRLERAAVAAELPETGVHILRHTFSSHLAMLGAPMSLIQALLGHITSTMTQRYVHLSPAALEGGIGLLDARLAGTGGNIVATHGGRTANING